MKGPAVAISRFLGHTVSGTAPGLCPHSTSEGPDNAEQNAVAGPQQHLFAKTGGVGLATPCSGGTGAARAAGRRAKSQQRDEEELVPLNLQTLGSFFRHA